MTSQPEKVRVELGNRSYDIMVDSGLIDSAGKAIRDAAGSGNCWVVTDDTVAPLYLDRLTTSLAGAGLTAETITLPAGESSKSFSTIENVVSAILEGAPERNATLIALGGGVVGDITGFAASMVLRGINFVQIPTTLLSQVDSSVGGKTGVNTRHGKNLAGAFYQPKLVIADTSLLDSLPRREMLAGYAEVVKYGLIRDASFFGWLEQNGEAVIDGDADARRYAIGESCRAKAAVVTEDERESGVRALLNFGHTFGHALETETGFGRELLHGEAVAIGMMLALELSALLGLCPPEDVVRTRAHFKSIGLPHGLPGDQGRCWSADVLIGQMGRDKKIRDGRITFILANGVGDAFVAHDIDLDPVKTILELAIAE